MDSRSHPSSSLIGNLRLTDVIATPSPVPAASDRSPTLNHNLKSIAGAPLTMARRARRGECRFGRSRSRRRRSCTCPATPTCPARITLLPTSVVPARPTCAHSNVSSPDGAAMADVNHVVDLGAAHDTSFADAGAVDAGVGLDFDVAYGRPLSGLHDLVPASGVVLGKAEAVGADDGPVL